MGDATVRAIGDWLTVWAAGALGSDEIFVILNFETSGTRITGDFIKNYLEIMTDSITAQLNQASEGLLFLSESDAPFEVINWPAQGELTPVKLLQLTNHRPDFLHRATPFFPTEILISL